ncbi:glycosyltransferase family 39 protein [Candidatus Sumerlaeota bacterium]|nr:glycosyltransferase family 39 protein [Candidatus Sumerlaeota bacterium]
MGSRLVPPLVSPAHQIHVNESNPRRSESSAARLTILEAILIVLLTLAAYFPALRGGFVWDDDLYISYNRTIQSPDGLLKIWTDPFSSPSPYPLIFSTYWLEFRLWGLDPFGYHLVNILLHAANALIVAAMMRRLALPGSFAAALFFALHPINAESVAWMTERKDVLSGFFFLLGLYYWIEFLDGTRRKHYILTLLCFAAALLSKTVSGTFPLIALLLAAWNRSKGTRLAFSRAITFAAPMIAFALALGFFTVWWEKVQLGNPETQFDFTPGQRLLIAGRAPWFYLGKLLFPSSLTLVYPRWKLECSSLGELVFPLL